MRKTNSSKTLLLILAGLIISTTSHAYTEGEGLGLWECSINVFGRSYYGSSFSETSARQKASDECNKSESSTFCHAFSANCRKTIGINPNFSVENLKHQVLIDTKEILSQCSTYEAYCPGIGGSSGYGSSIPEARTNMPVKCIPVSVRCIN